MAKNEISRPQTAHIAPFGLRLQPELKERVEAAARANGRSMNAEIAARLEASFSEAPQVSSLPDYIAFIEEFAAKQDELNLKTELQMAEMRADNADIALRGIRMEVRQLREEIDEAVVAGRPEHEIDELRGQLRIASAVLPQQFEQTKVAKERLEALRARVADLEKNTRQ
ncbi:Arc family DNA-binding protein [uncultured Pseudacidovorax sp.]|uniref:Arc family DNA-binding protein n=1 Tax=uncultured Pseudacidovorax sp. TaxID=679313 RepID=UPI0025F47586|nr:Arc family DNA-binding protein [uncultured Pseudacidovorax sp.]